jgi:hypothetical protein
MLLGYARISKRDDQTITTLAKAPKVSIDAVRPCAAASLRR